MDALELAPLEAVEGQIARLAAAEHDFLQVIVDSHETPRPQNLYAPDPNNPNAHLVAETTHTHPDALFFVAGLRTMLLNMHARIDSALVSPPVVTSPPSPTVTAATVVPSVIIPDPAGVTDVPPPVPVPQPSAPAPTEADFVPKNIGSKGRLSRYRWFNRKGGYWQEYDTKDDQ
jgi:hypothetical protein